MSDEEPPRYRRVTSEQRSLGWTVYPGVVRIPYVVVRDYGSECDVENPEWTIWRELQRRLDADRYHRTAPLDSVRKS